MITWSALKPLLAALDGRTPSFHDTQALEDLDTLLTDVTFMDLFFSKHGNINHSLAQHLFSTGNIAVAKRVTTLANRFPFSKDAKSCLGPDSFSFPFPLGAWPTQDAMAGLALWEQTLGPSTPQHYPALAISAVQHTHPAVLAWVHDQNLWQHCAQEKILQTLTDLLSTPANTTTKPLLEAIIAQAPLNAETCDPRNVNTPLVYAFGCAMFGVVPPKARFLEAFQGLDLTSAHTTLAFQRNLGAWQNWVGLGLSHGREKLRKAFPPCARP